MQENLNNLFNHDEFIARHIGVNQAEQQALLQAVGANNMQDFINQTVPESVRMPQPLNLPESLPEHEALAKT